MSKLPTQFQNFIHISRYARWDEDLLRRETWEETVNRYVNYMFDVRCKGKIDKDIKKEVTEAILNLEVMPSMRCLMTAGKALERDAAAAYNCSFVAINDVAAFDEMMYLLMVGCGVGFSVERQFINNLPIVADTLRPSRTIIKVDDSRLGWANAFRELLSMLYQGRIPEWDVSALRPAGARLKTFGGRASGPEPLIELFQFCVEIFKGAAGRKLNSIECHDIACKTGEIVISGGVRRCLPEGSMIFTPIGPLAVEEIVVGDTIITGGKIGKVISAGASGEKETIIIKHRFGILECTPEHRVAVFSSIMKYEFKQAKDIVEGDRLVWDSVGYDGIKTFLPTLGEDDLYCNANDVKIPELTPDVAWLIGLFHGDGYTSDSGLEISGNLQELATLERAGRILQDEFSLKSKSGRDGRPGVGARLRANSRTLSRWFQKYIKQPKIPIQIPIFIMNGSRDIRFSYLAGLLDADGRIRNGDNRMDEACTIYKEFADDIVTLCAGLGIAASVFYGSAERRRKCGENAQDFWNVSIVGSTNRKAFYDNCKQFSMKLQTKGVEFTGLLDFSFPIRWGGTNIGYAPNGNISVMKMRYDLPLLPTRVVSLEKGRTVKTFDIQVEGLEQFTTNGIVVHNSALLSLSNPSDDRMRYAKSGNWQDIAPWRYMANISACYTEKPGMDVFMREWLALYESKSGERGIFNREVAKKQAMRYGRRDPDKEYGCNPCSEILIPNCGLCNLSEIVIRHDDTEKSLRRKARLAAILGTMQATITDFHYLRSLWKKNAEEEALLGVSLTGIMDNELTSGRKGKNELKEFLSRLREHVVEVNKEWAKKLGINQAAATTCGKPSGCVSLDTKIKTDRGILSFAELFNLNRISPIGLHPDVWIEPKEKLSVFDENNDLQFVTKLYVNGMAEVYEIEDEDGNAYKFTGNHKLLTEIGWKRVDELTEKDVVISFK